MKFLCRTSIMSLKQQHYRRLMKQQKAKATSNQKIEHPLARYNTLGQLSCIVCTTHIKSELLWNTHLQSHKHKDSMVAAKNKKTYPGSQSSAHAAMKTTGIKRKPTDSDLITDEGSHPSPKRLKSEQSSHLSPVDQHTEVASVRYNSSLPPNFFDSGVSTESRNEGVNMDVNERQPRAQEQKGLPTEFFDEKPKSNVPTDTQEQNTEESTSRLPSTSLPEGFFDDPKQDAKARKVEYKDPAVEEWEKFQKSIQKEDDVSDALVLELDVESKEDREVTEVQDQVSCYLRAETLRQKQEQLVQSKETTKSDIENTINDPDETSSSDDLDFEELFNWRSKIS